MPNVMVTCFFFFFFPPSYGDHYEWNKIITCIHNVFSQQRHLEHYGDVTITNKNSNVCTCKITFVKVSTLPRKSPLSKWIHYPRYHL